MRDSLRPDILDSALFDPANADDETKALNASIVEKMNALPNTWEVPITLVRERRRQGIGPFPPMKKSERARIRTIEGPGGPLELRVIAPENPRGIYYHIHGGGWSIGTADEQDPWLDRIADNCGLTCVSVEYRLGPEYPHPAPLDDCEAAALWLHREGEREFGAKLLAIGGESAGAHLSLATMIRLRDRHGLSPFAGANLFAGCYDVAMTPSAVRFGDEKLVINTPLIRYFADNFCPAPIDRRAPDVSPLYADLAGLPRCLLSCGTRDPLIDDTLFLHAKLIAAGGKPELAIWPGGCHVFTRFESSLGERALARIDDFLNELEF